MGKAGTTNQQQQNGGAIRTRAHFFDTYVRHELIEQVFQMHAHQILHSAYILHDKDKNDDGTDKHEHTHVLLYLKNPVSLSAVQNWFFDAEQGQNTRNPFPCGNVGKAFEYLTHKNNPEKASYDDSEVIVSEDDRLWFEQQQTNDGTDPLQNALFDKLEGRSTKELVEHYGRDFIIHHKQISEIAREIRAEELTPVDEEMMFSVTQMQADEIRHLQQELRNVLFVADAAIKALASHGHTKEAQNLQHTVECVCRPLDRPLKKILPDIPE